MRFLPWSAFVLACCLALPNARASEATVAVAANFTEVAHQLQADFERDSSSKIAVVVGSTGGLYAQIMHGAPFDIMLAADQRRPRLLEESGDAVAGTRFTYAIGRLTLWSPNPHTVTEDGMGTLTAAKFAKLAMADPKLAPYGSAAKEVLTKLGLYEKLTPRIVTGANIAQTFTMVQTGNADLGFVALSYVVSKQNASPGSRWDVPQHLYTPIRQDAVLLKHGNSNVAARAFLQYLRSPHAIQVIQRFGYAIENPEAAEATSLELLEQHKQDSHH